MRQDDTLDKVIQVWEQMNNDKSLYDLFKSAEDVQEDYERSLISEREAGYNNGIEQGIDQHKLSTAKAMLNKGLDIELISEISGLTIKKIKHI